MQVPKFKMSNISKSKNTESVISLYIAKYKREIAMAQTVPFSYEHLKLCLITDVYMWLEE